MYDSIYSTRKYGDVYMYGSMGEYGDEQMYDSMYCTGEYGDEHMQDTEYSK